MIEEALTASGLAPERLVLEITESVALDDIAGTMSAIARLDRIGVAFALELQAQRILLPRESVGSRAQ